MKRRSFIGLSVLAVLADCGHGATANGPSHLPTLPPTGAFKDGLLYAAVKARLAGADIDAAMSVSVIVHAGVVTLRGAVRDPAAQVRFVKLAHSIRGVTGVVDELHVGPTTSLGITVKNISLVAAVTSNMTEQAGVNISGVTVHADNGTITLAGHASTAAIRSTLVAAARHTTGVRNVVDRIVVK